MTFSQKNIFFQFMKWEKQIFSQNWDLDCCILMRVRSVDYVI